MASLISIVVEENSFLPRLEQTTDSQLTKIARERKSTGGVQYTHCPDTVGVGKDIHTMTQMADEWGWDLGWDLGLNLWE
jgi:hypothetical protein